MKKLLKRLGIFLSVIIILAYPADWIISNGLKNSTLADGELEIWNDIYTQNVNSDYIICGSSRSWVHIDPKILDEKTGKTFYNFGMDAHNFYLQNLRFEEFLKYNPKPKGIIYSLDIFMLAKREDLYNSNQFLPYMLWNKELEKVLSTYQSFEKSDYIIPMLRYVGNFSAIKSGIKYYFAPDDHFRYKGYKGKEEVWNNDLDKAKEQMTSYTARLDSASISLFEDFLENCDKAGIPLIFVYSPEYIEGQTFVANRDSIMNMYKEWAKEYNIPFLDYSNDSISYSKDNFYNSLHMNNTGSKLFTKELADDLLKDNLLK